MKTTIATTTLLLALGLSGMASTASAGLYTGNWPFKVTGAKQFDGPKCLTLEDTGSPEHPSGTATLPGTHGGTFVIIDHLLLAILDTSGEGEVSSLVITAPASHGMIGDGIYAEPEGDYAYPLGKALFSKKGGC